MSGEQSSFQELLTRVNEGSQEAAWQLIERYGSHIRAVVRRRMHPSLRTFLDSEDFVQSVWGSLVRIGPRLTDIDHPEQLVALMAKIARNKVIDEVRRRTKTEKHRVTHQMPPEDFAKSKIVTIQYEQPTPSQFAVARERWEFILKGETETAKRVVELRLGGRTYVEIASELGINERTVRRTIDRLIARGGADIDDE